MDNPFITVEYWNAVLRIATPIGFAALGCLLCSRAGVLLIGVEGIMLGSAFFGIAGTVWTDSIWLGFLIGVASGVLISQILGLLTMRARMGDVVGGLVVHIGAIGVTGFLLAEWFSETGATTGGKQLEAPWPEFGGALVGLVLHQQPLVYAMIAIAIALHLSLRSLTGLTVRAAGESMRAAMALGIRLIPLRFLVLAVSGAIVGCGGAFLGVGVAGTFGQPATMIGGQGFIGLACVMFGAWRPLQALAATMIFAAAYALQFRVLSDDLSGWLQLLPYVVVLAAIMLRSSARGPAEEGQDLPEAAYEASRRRAGWRPARWGGKTAVAGDGK
ncbi:MAG: ABC transporter permease [Gaiellaceae bacterium]